MPGPPIDIGTGHEPRITPARAATEQLALRRLEEVDSPAGIKLLKLLAGENAARMSATIEHILNKGIEPVSELAHTEPALANLEEESCIASSAAAIDGPLQVAAPPPAASSALWAATEAFYSLRKLILEQHEDGKWGFSLDDLGDNLFAFLVDGHTRARVERYVIKSTDEVLSAAVEKLEPDLAKLCCIKSANAVVEHLFEYSPPPIKERVLAILEPHLRRLILHEEGHYVVRTIVAQGSAAHIRFVLNALAPDISLLASNRTSASCLEHALDRAAPLDLAVIVPHIISSLDVLAHDPQGSRYIQQVLRRAPADISRPLVQEIAGYSQTGIPRMHALVMGKNSSFIISAALESAVMPEVEHVVEKVYDCLNSLGEQRTDLHGVQGFLRDQCGAAKNRCAPQIAPPIASAPLPAPPPSESVPHIPHPVVPQLAPLSPPHVDHPPPSETPPLPTRPRTRSSSPQGRLPAPPPAPKSATPTGYGRFQALRSQKEIFLGLKRAKRLVAGKEEGAKRRKVEEQRRADAEPRWAGPGVEDRYAGAFDVPRDGAPSEAAFPLPAFNPPTAEGERARAFSERMDPSSWRGERHGYRGMKGWRKKGGGDESHSFARRGAVGRREDHR